MLNKNMYFIPPKHATPFWKDYFYACGDKQKFHKYVHYICSESLSDLISLAKLKHFSAIMWYVYRYSPGLHHVHRHTGIIVSVSKSTSTKRQVPPFTNMV